MSDTESTASQQQRRQSLRWLYGFLRPQRSRIAALAGLSLVTTAMVLAQPYLTKLIIDDGLLANNFDALLLYSLSLLVLGFVSTLLSGVNRIQHTRLSGNVLFALREDVYRHLQTLSPRFFSQQRIGDLISRMDRDVSEIQRFAVDTLFTLFSGVLGLVGTVTMMLLLSWQLSLALVILIPLEALYLHWIRSRVQNQNRNVRERTADISSFLAETLPAMKFIQTAGAEDREASKLGKLNQLFITDLVQLQKTEFMASAIPSMLISTTRALIFLLGGYWVIQGNFALGSLIAFTAYLGMAFGPVQSLLGLYLAWQRLMVSLDRVRHLRDQVPEIAAHGGEEVPQGLKGNLQLDNISFGYTDNAPIFSGANLSIAAGSKVGIFGPSGIGKSTLIDLLQCHLPLTSGRILLDNLDIATFDVRQWRRSIAVVSQDVVIFRDTIANNIRYCQPTASDLEIQKVAAQAGLEPLLNRLPSGLASEVGERGCTLSGGERQRIALARALLQDPVLLILDEPTSAIDLESEQQLIDCIDKLFANTTRLLISHRETPISNAEILLTIQNGQLITVDRDQSAAYG